MLVLGVKAECHHGQAMSITLGQDDEPEFFESHGQIVCSSPQVSVRNIELVNDQDVEHNVLTP